MRMPVWYENRPVEIKVWMDDWQMQCCGEPFAVGDEVSWTLRDPDTEWLALVLGSEPAGGVDKAEEHHGGIGEGATPTVGIVTAIHAVRCRYAPLPDEAETQFAPVAGSGTLDAIRSVDGWTPDQGDLKFAGYLVQLEVEWDVPPA
jgi:hypothetical protein